MFTAMRSILFTFSLFLTSACLANQNYVYHQNVIHGPFDNKLAPNTEIYFSKSADIKFPVYMILSQNSKIRNGKEIVIDKYESTGGSPIVESVFFYPINGIENIFVILSWEINSLGVGTQGKLYQTYSYINSNNNLIRNRTTNIDQNLSGFDGQQEGEKVSFNLTTAIDVKRYINTNYNQRPTLESLTYQEALQQYHASGGIETYRCVLQPARDDYRPLANSQPIAVEIDDALFIKQAGKLQQLKQQTSHDRDTSYALNNSKITLKTALYVNSREYAESEDRYIDLTFSNNKKTITYKAFARDCGI